ncbi:hypothetical protein FRACA_2260005 [Frankia canadensis]|uniref:Uncharacterized protein n=1 Tax=Frankia canadensis TaxID=1836972 RepID=A0A2I2KR82_9ACTN|nr:hypothetical protein FRACA_2260005 [Frankia canadensis]SOU55468.1 hypothetical protein FRACA_2260005 [Frankia canadensis]
MIVAKPRWVSPVPIRAAQAMSETPRATSGERLRRYSAVQVTAQTRRTRTGTSARPRTTIESPGPSITNTVMTKAAAARTASAVRGQRAKGPRRPFRAPGLDASEVGVPAVGVMGLRHLPSLWWTRILVGTGDAPVDQTGSRYASRGRPSPAFRRTAVSPSRRRRGQDPRRVHRL